MSQPKIKLVTTHYDVEYKTPFSAGFDLKAVLERDTEGLFLNTRTLVDLWREFKNKPVHTIIGENVFSNAVCHIKHHFILTKSHINKYFSFDYTIETIEYLVNLFEEELSAELEKYETYCSNAGENEVLSFYEWLDDKDPTRFNFRLIIPFEKGMVKTGIFSEIEPGYEIQVRGRSGINLKEQFTVMIGTIDSDYRGEWGVIFHNQAESFFIIREGDRIAQAVLNKIEQADFEYVADVNGLSTTQRGEGGFGSTGIK